MTSIAVQPAPHFLAVQCLQASPDVTALVDSDETGPVIATNRIGAGRCIRVLTLGLGGQVAAGVDWGLRQTLQVEGWAGKSGTQASEGVAWNIARTARGVLAATFRGWSDDLGLIVSVLSVGAPWHNPDPGQTVAGGFARSRVQFEMQVVFRPHALTPLTGS